MGKAEQAGNATHDVVLQRLDQETEYGKYTPEAFEPTAHLWDGIPLVFAQQHPDAKAMLDDPISELARIDGRVVGSVKGGEIAAEGTPRLMGGFDWANDEEVQKAYEEGKLGHSTSFFYGGKGKDGAVMGPIIPNHVLLFRMDGTIQPKDKGAMILNAEQIKAGDAKGFVDRLKAWWAQAPVIGASGQGDEDVNEKEYEQKLASVNAEMTEAKTKLVSIEAEAGKNAEEIKRLGGELKSANDRLAEHDKVAKDAAWNAVKAKIPVGMTAGDKEKAAREEFELHPAEFMLEALNAVEKAPGETHEQGSEHAAGNAGEEKGVDRWNPVASKFEKVK